jgi:glutathione S-transferase
MVAMSPEKKTIKSWPKLTLYGDLNMRPFRNIWMLEEIGTEYRHVNCKPWSKQAKAVHPLGKVPALLVEGNDNEQQQFVVVESAAINTFLGDLAREIERNTHKNDDDDSTPLVLVPPPATQHRAKYDSLTMFIMTELDSQALWIHRKHSDLKDVFGEAPIAVSEAKRQFDNALGAIELELNDENGYLLPCGFSATDIVLSNCCFWAQQIGWLARSSNESTAPSTNGNTATIPMSLSPKLASYLAQCKRRKAFIKANELRKDQVSEREQKQYSKI